MPEPSPSDATADPPPPRPATGRTVAGRYRLERRLARGGMSEVWEATDEVLARAVAVKILHPHLAADEVFVTRFRREAVSSARLAHPSIVSVFDTCSDGDLEAIVMELVRGHTLRQLLDERGSLPERRAVEIAAHVADALQHAHESGIVHRDIKPGNILLSDDGRVLVTDFGIAKAAADAAEDHSGGHGADLTEVGAVVGTVKYLSPEQVEAGPVDARSDVYALGVVLYEMLCGKVPFEGTSPYATAAMRLHTDPLLPRQHRAGIARELEEIVMRAMARAPGERYPSAGQLRSALWSVEPDDDATAVGEVTPPGGSPALEPTFAQTERSWILPAFVILLVAAGLAVSGTLLSQTDVGRQIFDGARGAVGGARAQPGPPAVIVGLDAYDPPPGDGWENDDQLPHLVDGDPGTTWRTETYNTAAFGGLKDGVGVVIRLEQATALRAIEVDSVSTGWSAELYVAAEPAPDLAGWGDPVATAGGVGHAHRFDLGRTEGAAVLVWITHLGDGGRTAVEWSQLRLIT